MSVFDAEVRKLAEKHRDRIRVLKVMCQLAADAERVSGRPLFDAEAVRIHPVSYTHLDVYKRQ